MPEIREWEEQEFPTDRRASKVAAYRTGDRASRGLVSHRTIKRSPDPCLRILEYADRFRLDGPARKVIEPDRKILRHLACCCLERSNLLAKSSRHADALVAVSAHWRDWLRPLDDWEPPDEDPRAQFGSLARHLFALYNIPIFLDDAWRAGLHAEGLRYQGWYKHVGRGESIKTLPDLPIPLTRVMAHFFAQGPDDLDIPSALRWAQVRGLGGDEGLARTVLESRIGTDFRNDDFWTTVIRWLVAHPDLAPRHHGPIIDYLHDQRFVPSVPNPLSRQRGRARQPLAIPPQSNLCMNGRTPKSLLRAVEEWHKKLGSQRSGISVEWRPSCIRPFSCEVGDGPSRRVFAITELISSEELQEEGKAMGHCVASYWPLCISGQASIWSLTVEDGSGEADRLLTLQVSLPDRLIVQARGPNNREPDDQQRSILARWAESGGPSPSRGLLIEPPIEE
jgi:hypothetical protein